MPCLSQYLSSVSLESSAPHRLDVGGTWDLKALALPYEHIVPSTVNIAIALKTRVRLQPYLSGRVRITDGTYAEAFALAEVPFDSRFGLLWAIVSHLQVDGFEMQLRYEAPSRAGLGGSGTLAVAVLAALMRASHPGESDFLSPSRKVEIVELAHQLEDGLHFSYTGMQDQAAAAFGGVNLWEWRYAARTDHPGGRDGTESHAERYRLFTREPVLPPARHAELSDRLIVAYIGQSHQSSDVNARQVADFYAGSTRGQWLEINRIARDFHAALRAGEYAKAAALALREHEIRINLVPSRITPIGRALQARAEACGCGFAVSGAGNGGCVWSLAPDPALAEVVRGHWRQMLSSVETARVLDAPVDGTGVALEEHPR
jgi:D-glycero-alpha-D-manno-heptose-7-phosphate kinase